MFVSPPDGIVGRVARVNFRIDDCNILNRGPSVNLINRGLDVVLTGQPGMLQARGLGELLGVPNQLQACGELRPASGAELGEIFMKHMMNLSLHHKLDNLVIILDTSSSMTFDNDQKLNLVKEQIKKLGAFIPTGTKVSVVQFSGEARTVINAVEINNAIDFDRKIVIPIKSLVTSSGTNIQKALATASSQIATVDSYNHEHPERNLMILLTDGDHRPYEVEEYLKVYRTAQVVSPLRNAPLIVMGIGTDYNPEVIQAIAGFSGGMWLHTSKSNTKVDPFGGLIPVLIKQITGNDFCIRCDMYDTERVWQVDPSVNEIPYLQDRVGIEGRIGLHQFRPGFWDEPTAIAVFGKDGDGNPRYFLTGQEDMRIFTGRPDNLVIPEDFGRELDILQLDELPLELRNRAEGSIKKWLLSLTLQKRDLGALYALHKAEIIDDNAYNFFKEALGSNKDEEHSRTFGSNLSATNWDLSHHSIGPTMEQIKPALNIEPQGSNPNLADPDFGQKLDNLGKIKIPKNLRQEVRRGFLPDSMVEGQSFRSRTGGLSLHSGILGPLDASIQEDLGLLTHVNPQAYDQAQPISPKLKVRFEKLSGDGNINPCGPFDFSKKTTYKIGRSTICDIQISDPNTSKVHCEIVRQGNEIIIRDLGSKNGTYVNSRKITEVKLANDDEIRVGQIVFKVKI